MPTCLGISSVGTWVGNYIGRYLGTWGDNWVAPWKTLHHVHVLGVGYLRQHDGHMCHIPFFFLQFWPPMEGSVRSTLVLGEPWNS